MTGWRRDLLGMIFLALLGSVLGLLANPRALRARQVEVRKEGAFGQNQERGAWLAPISPETLREGLRAGRLRLVDARSASDFVKGHVPGSLPLWKEPAQSQLPFLVSWLDPEATVVVTDETGEGFAAMQLAFKLRRRGFAEIRFLEGGLAAWRARGFESTSGWDFDFEDPETEEGKR